MLGSKWLLGFRVEGFGFRVEGLGCCWDLGLRVFGILGFGVLDSWDIERVARAYHFKGVA